MNTKECPSKNSFPTVISTELMYSAYSQFQVSEIWTKALRHSQGCKIWTCEIFYADNTEYKNALMKLKSCTYGSSNIISKKKY